MFRKHFFPLIVMGSMIVPAMALGQDRGSDRGGDRGGDRRSSDQGGGRGRGNWDPAQMRERYMTDTKERLAASEDEWKVIEPKLTKVLDAQRASRGGFRGFGRGGRDNNAPAADAGPVERAMYDLSQVLDDKNAPSEQINAKLGALREAREKTRAELQSAQKDLKEVLTPRQEAVLVERGMLD